MAFDITLYNFQKDTNSTKVPAAAGTEFQCLMITGSSVIAPTVQLDAADLTGYNYAYIPAFHRYYFIRDCRYSAGFWEIDLTCDVLATYKTAIGNSDLYILRSAAESDGTITDGFYPPRAACTVSRIVQDLDTVPLPNFSTGYYLVSVLGASTTAGGAEFLYQLDPVNFQAMIRTLYTDIYQWGVTDIIDKLAQSFGGNPQQLISDVIWVPYAFPGVATNVMIFGGYSLSNINATVVTKTVIDLATFTYTVPKHPKAASKGKYLNCAPFSDYMLNINCGGIVSLDSTKLVDVDTLTVSRTLDVKGNLITTVTGGGYDFAKISGQMGVRISLSGSNTGSTLLSSIITTGANIGTAIASGNIGNAIGSVGSGIGSIAGAMSGASSNTASGSVADIGDPGRLVATFYDIPDEDNARNGRPLCKVRKPSALGGYMQAQKGDITAPGATAAELDAIRTYLEGGFYYE